jgi:aminopeptidase N
MGHQSFTQGLHAYFQKFQWKNTELKDFVGCMKEAFDATGDKSLLGEGFNLAEWCDSWLTTSGVNILEPVLVYKEDGSLQSFIIK